MAPNFVVESQEVTVRILDNDLPHIFIISSEMREGDPGQTNFMRFEVQYTPPVDTTVGVSYESAADTALPNLDFVPVRGVLEFPRGVTNLSILVPIIGDDALESDETFHINLHTPQGLLISHESRGLGVIHDDDLPESSKVTNIALHGSFIAIRFLSLRGWRYHLQWKASLSEPWLDGGESETAAGSSMSINFSIPSADQQPSGFFRIVGVP